MQFLNTVIQVFCKAPVPGTVKTRLMPGLTAIQAAEVHRHLTLQTLSLVAEADLCHVQLWCSPDAEHPFFQQIASNFPVTIKIQPAGDLGNRMNFALTEGLLEYRQAVLLGCDCPSFTRAEIQAALSAFESGYQAVLAPTEDGGYSMIGLNQASADLFKCIKWSTPSVLPQTRSKLKKAGISCFELPTQWDIDTYSDYLRFLKEFKPYPAQSKI